MATVTKLASSNTVVTTGWTNPTNAYANDNVYATSAPARNASVTSDFGFAAFTTADIPDGSTINSVTITAGYFANSTASTGAVFGLQIVDNGVLQGTESTFAIVLTETVASKAETTGVVLSDLRTAGLIKARVRGGRANSNNAITWSLDYVQITVDYTVAVSISAPVTGVSGTGQIGDPNETGTAVAPVTGQQGNGQPGAVTVVAVANTVADATGQTAQSGVGNVSVSVAVSVSVGGTVGYSQQGNLSARIFVAGEATGQQGSGQAGEVSVVINALCLIDGAQAQSAVGDVSAGTVVEAALLGVSATAFAGSPVVFTGVSVAAEGNYATGAVGEVDVSPDANSGSVWAAALVGMVSASIGVSETVSGVAATGQIGAVAAGPVTEVQLAGSSGVGLVGEMQCILSVDADFDGVHVNGLVGFPRIRATSVFGIAGTASSGFVGAVHAAQDTDVVVTFDGRSREGQVGFIEVKIGALNDGKSAKGKRNLTVWPPGVSGSCKTGKVESAVNVDAIAGFCSSTGKAGGPRVRAIQNPTDEQIEKILALLEG